MRKYGLLSSASKNTLISLQLCDAVTIRAATSSCRFSHAGFICFEAGVIMKL